MVVLRIALNLRPEPKTVFGTSYALILASYPFLFQRIAKLRL